MVEFKFIEYGTDFGTRDMGKKLREKLLPLINGDEKVVLDFTGVNVVSNSFADECIAKLLLEMPLEQLKAKTTFTGFTPMIERSILTALKRRQMQINNASGILSRAITLDTTLERVKDGMSKIIDRKEGKI